MVVYNIFIQVSFNTIAYDTGLRDRDFIVDVNGTSVFEMSHEECKELIKAAGNQMTIKVER
jgi:C-terminal processing protease CtpA/Prc